LANNIIKKSARKEKEEVEKISIKENIILEGEAVCFVRI
jgi:hypothetical protein